MTELDLERDKPAPPSGKLEKLVAELILFAGSAPDCCVLGWDGSDRPRVAGAGGACEVVLGTSAARLLGTAAGALFVGGERAARDLALACAKEPLCLERPLLRGGSRFPGQLMLRGSPDGGAVALVRDLTRAHSQADLALRSEDLARFASLVAHEVRNPLSAVKIALQTLEKHGQLGVNDLRRASIAIREVGNIELLLNEVLEFARPPSLSLVPLDPREPVREVALLLESEWAQRNVLVTLRLPDRMALVQADPTRVRAAVKILGRQAALAVEEAGGGQVEIAVHELDPQRWELSVTDTGPTLPPELREKAFLPFTPNRARGTGLGLAVVARIAREHGGLARLDARPAGGSVVTVTFAG